MKWTLIDRNIEYQGFFRVDKLRLTHTLFSGDQSRVLERELIQHTHANNAVAVLPYDPLRDNVVLIEQFRTGAIESPEGPWLVEIVAGLIEFGEDAEHTAHRETQEETGFELQVLQHVYDYYSSPGGLKERVSLYMGKVDAHLGEKVLGVEIEDEDIRVIVLPREKAFAQVADGQITSAQPIIALQWLQMNYKWLQKRWRA